MSRNSLDLIEQICDSISVEMGDAGISFRVAGECRSWEDLRYGYFQFNHVRWRASWGAAPTFGCYALAVAEEDALSDLRLGKISSWINIVSTAIDLLEHSEEEGSIWATLDRINRVQSGHKAPTLFDALMRCSLFTQGNFGLAKEAFESGVFFSFKLQPGSKFSDDIQGLFLPRRCVGSYLKWWSSEPSVVLIEASQRVDVISHARLRHSSPSEFFNQPKLPERASDLNT